MLVTSCVCMHAVFLWGKAYAFFSQKSTLGPFVAFLEAHHGSTTVCPLQSAQIAPSDWWNFRTEVGTGGCEPFIISKKMGKGLRFALVLGAR